MPKTSWNSFNPTEEPLKTVPPAKPFLACRDPAIKDRKGRIIHEGHRDMTFRMWEHGGDVCGICDPKSAYPGWGRVIDELLSDRQLALVQKVRQEEEQERKEQQYG